MGKLTFREVQELAQGNTESGRGEFLSLDLSGANAHALSTTQVKAIWLVSDKEKGLEPRSLTPLNSDLFSTSYYLTWKSLNIYANCKRDSYRIPFLDFLKSKNDFP